MHRLLRPARAFFATIALLLAFVPLTAGPGPARASETPNWDASFKRSTLDGSPDSTLRHVADVGAASDSVTVGNLPYAAYYDATNGNLDIASRTRQGWSWSVLDGDRDDPATGRVSADVGDAVSLVVGPDGKLRAYYHDRTHATLRQAVQSNGAWSYSTIATSTCDIGTAISAATFTTDNSIHVFARESCDGGRLVDVTIRTSSPGEASRYTLPVTGVGDDVDAVAFDNPRTGTEQLHVFYPAGTTLGHATFDGGWAYETLSGGPAPVLAAEAGLDTGANVSAIVTAEPQGGTHVTAQVFYYDRSGGNLRRAIFDGSGWFGEVVDGNTTDSSGRLDANVGTEVHALSEPQLGVYVTYRHSDSGDLRFAGYLLDQPDWHIETLDGDRDDSATGRRNGDIGYSPSSTLFQDPADRDNWYLGAWYGMQSSADHDLRYASMFVKSPCRINCVVYAVNPAPTASFTVTPNPGRVHTTVFSFDASASKAGGVSDTIATYGWDWDGDGYVDSSTSSPTTTHTFADCGTMDVTLHVVDSGNRVGLNPKSDTATVPVTVTCNKAPVADFTWSPSLVDQNTSVKFTATATDDLDPPARLRYEWKNVTTGARIGTGNPVSYSFGSPGAFTVALTVTDSEGGMTTVSKSVTVCDRLAWKVSAAKCDGYVNTVTDGDESANGVARASDGTMYVSDTYNHVVVRVGQDGKRTTVLGEFGRTGTDDAHLDNPRGISLHPNGKKLYIADTQNHRVQVLDIPSGETHTVVNNSAKPGYGYEAYCYEQWPNGGCLVPMTPDNMSLNSPESVTLWASGSNSLCADACDGDVLFVADTNNNVVEATRFGNTYGSSTGLPYKFYGLWNAAGNALSPGKDYPNGQSSNDLDISAPRAVTTYGRAGAAGSGYYFSDSGTDLVYRVANADQYGVGTISLAFGHFEGEAGSDQSNPSNVQLADPRGVALDPAGQLYLTDASNCRLYRKTSAGKAEVLSGQSSCGTAGDGAPAVAASLYTPNALAVSGGSGRELYVLFADRTNGLRQAWYANGVPATLLPSNAGITGSMHIRDDEISTDVYCDRYFSSWAYLQTAGSSANLYGEGRCDGEVRAELHTSARLNSDGSVTFSSPQVLLYEGMSESTDDLDGSATISSVTVPKGSAATRTVRVTNTAEDCDDAVDVSVTFSNQ